MPTLEEKSALEQSLKESETLVEELKARLLEGAPFFQFQYVPWMVVNFLDSNKFLKMFAPLYIKYYKIFNYLLVCGGIGVLVNQIVLHTYIATFPLWIADCLAIGAAATSNYIFTVGPLGYLFGLSARRRGVKA